MEGDTPDFHVFQFSFLAESLPEWKTKLGVPDPVSYAIALGVHVATKRIGLFESVNWFSRVEFDSTLSEIFAPSMHRKKTHFSSLHSLFTKIIFLNVHSPFLCS